MNALSVSDCSKDSTGSQDLPGTAQKKIGYIPRTQNANIDANAFVGARALLIVVMFVETVISRRLSSFRFRFSHVLRMPENVQVADGPEPARARGMRQNLVYLSILSQHHANEVQSFESPEEGARLLRFISTSDRRRNNSLIRFVIDSR